MSRLPKALIRHLASIELPTIDMDKMLRETVINLGVPKKWIRTPEQVAAFRKRSAAAKLGWRRRRKLYAKRSS